MLMRLYMIAHHQLIKFFDKQHMNATICTAVQKTSIELATPGSDPTMLLAQFMPVQ